MSQSRSLTAPAAATGGLLVPLAILDRRMRATGGTGIIPFELAGRARSKEILRAWGTGGQRAARASLLLDFPYLVAYTVLGVRLTSRAGDALGAAGAGGVSAAAPGVAAIQIAAGACDAIENAALLGVVARGGDDRFASIARTAARAKFAGLMLACVYDVVGFLTEARAARRAGRPRTRAARFPLRPTRSARSQAESGG